jgi:hypothetical protein
MGDFKRWDTEALFPDMAGSLASHRKLAGYILNKQPIYFAIGAFILSISAQFDSSRSVSTTTHFPT